MVMTSLNYAASGCCIHILEQEKDISGERKIYYSRNFFTSLGKNYDRVDFHSLRLLFPSIVCADVHWNIHVLRSNGCLDGERKPMLWKLNGYSLALKKLVIWYAYRQFCIYIYSAFEKEENQSIKSKLTYALSLTHNVNVIFC